MSVVIALANQTIRSLTFRKGKRSINADDRLMFFTPRDNQVPYLVFSVGFFQWEGEYCETENEWMLTFPENHSPGGFEELLLQTTFDSPSITVRTTSKRNMVNRSALYLPVHEGKALVRVHFYVEQLIPYQGSRRTNANIVAKDVWNKEADCVRFTERNIDERWWMRNVYFSDTNVDGMLMIGSWKEGFPASTQHRFFFNNRIPKATAGTTTTTTPPTIIRKSPESNQDCPILFEPIRSLSKRCIQCNHYCSMEAYLPSVKQECSICRGPLDPSIYVNN